VGKTTIEWTATQHPDGTWTPGYTFNPWWGCIEVSPGCTNCYARTLSKRWGHNIWGPAKTTQRRLMSEDYWRQPLKWDAAAEKAGTRARVFCASMADVFEDHPSVTSSRIRLWDLIRETPMLDWLLLTKRPENILHMIPDWWRAHPQHNIWFGTSVENQEYADKRIPELLKVPAAVRFLSCEPLLGPVDLDLFNSMIVDERDPAFGGPGYGRPDHKRPNKIAWVIAGGESGPQARPAHPDWFRSLRDQCQAAGIAFHFKQWGEWMPSGGRDDAPNRWVSHGSPGAPVKVDYLDTRSPAHVIRVGKKAAGRLLDGREWNQFPEVQHAPA
jgi:protein gp37